MKISTTERGSAKRCRRQWNVNSRNRWGLTRIVAPGPLALGTLCHSSLGLWIDMVKRYQELVVAGAPRDKQLTMVLPEGGLSELFLQYAKKTIDEAKAVYERQVGASMSDSELAPLYESVTQGRCMMDNYQAFWKRPVPDDFDIIATEQRCVVPIPGSEHTEEWVLVQPDAAAAPYVWEPQLRRYNETRWHYLEGKLDAVLRERRTGKLYVLEHKTYGQRPREDVLFANDQFLSYHWILIQLAEQMGFNPRDVAGVAYDGLWKRAAPPKVVDGHKGALGDLFVRRLITRPAQELIEFEEMLLLEVRELASNPPIYLNRTSDGSCFWGCSDNQLCLAMSRGEDVDYILRSQYKRKEPDEDMDVPRELA